MRKKVGDVKRKVSEVLTSIKKHKKKIILGIFILAFLFIISSGTYLFGLLQLVTKGDVLISIEPEQSFVLTNRQDSQEISYNVEIENRFACNALCEYRFKDLATDLVIDTGEFIGVAGTKFSKNYSITPPLKGTGQKAYELYIQCQNKEEFLCLSGKGTRVKSSFITVGYELSSEESDFMESTKTKLLSYLTQLNLFDQYLQGLINQGMQYQSFFPDANFNSIVTEINSSILTLINQTENLKNSWQAEEISILSDSITQSEERIIRINDTVEQLKNLISLKDQEYNLTLFSIEQYESQLKDVNLVSKASSILKEGSDVKSLFVEPFAKIVFDFNNNSSTQTIQKITSLETKYVATRDSFTEKVNNLIKIGKATFNPPQEYSSINYLNDSVDSFTALCDSMRSVDSGIEANTFYSLYCLYSSPELINLNNYNFSLKELPKFELGNLSRVSSEIYVHKPTCCIFGKCEPCCTNSCEVNEGLYPVVLVHGHAFSEDSSVSYSLGGFSKIRKQLVQDGFIDAGTILPTENVVDSVEGYLGRFGKPIVVGTTYYFGAYDEEGNFLSVPLKSESIVTYAQRLNQSIEIIKQKTGSSKVNIVAYSMGGLVSRQYLADFGESSVNKIILIGTPNKGISGTIESFCPIIGAQKECLEMTSTSSFINQLNKPENNPKNVKVYTFVGKGCNMDGKDGDGVSLAESVELPYSLNFEIIGSCSTDKTLHQELTNIEKYPKVYSTLKTILLQ